MATIKSTFDVDAKVAKSSLAYKFTDSLKGGHGCAGLRGCVP